MAASMVEKLVAYGLTAFILLLPITNPETVLGQNNDDFDFDGLPGVQHEFKVEIPPGREECFYQMVKRAAQLHISFEVGDFI